MEGKENADESPSESMIIRYSVWRADFLTNVRKLTIATHHWLVCVTQLIQKVLRVRLTTVVNSNALLTKGHSFYFEPDKLKGNSISWIGDRKSVGAGCVRRVP